MCTNTLIVYQYFFFFPWVKSFDLVNMNDSTVYSYIADKMYMVAVRWYEFGYRSIWMSSLFVNLK